MDDNQRLQLQNMINENNVIDKTEMIRQIKHSNILRNEVKEMIKIKNNYKNNLDSHDFRDEAIDKCKFLFQYYTDIFNKLRKDEIDVNMLFEFLDILEKIEKKELNQHEASFQVGSILKNMYIDSAIKHAENLEKKNNSLVNSSNNNNDTPDEVKPKSKDISWKHFKKIKNMKSFK